MYAISWKIMETPSIIVETPSINGWWLGVPPFQNTSIYIIWRRKSFGIGVASISRWRKAKNRCENKQMCIWTNKKWKLVRISPGHKWCKQRRNWTPPTRSKNPLSILKNKDLSCAYYWKSAYFVLIMDSEEWKKVSNKLNKPVFGYLKS